MPAAPRARVRSLTLALALLVAAPPGVEAARKRAARTDAAPAATTQPRARRPIRSLKRRLAIGGKLDLGAPPRTVFGKPEPGLHTVHSDEFFDERKAEDAADIADRTSGFPRRTGGWYTAMLSAYYNFQVVLRHIEVRVDTVKAREFLEFGFRLARADERE